MIVLGIDPGATGAIAALDVDGRLVDIGDLPYIGGALSAPLLAEQLEAYLQTYYGDDVDAWLERAQAMPRQGVTSVFNYGTGYGTIIGVLGALEVPVQTVRPATWKKAAGLVGADKAASRRRAIELWPERAGWFARAKDDGRAEAALIARYGWLTERMAVQ